MTPVGAAADSAESTALLPLVRSCQKKVAAVAAVLVPWEEEQAWPADQLPSEEAEDQQAWQAALVSQEPSVPLPQALLQLVLRRQVAPPALYPGTPQRRKKQNPAQ